MKVIDFGYEECKFDKEKVDVIAGPTMVHFILDGEGTFNGKPLKKGEGFFALEGERACYFPNPENPWTYLFVNVNSLKGVLAEYSLLSDNRCFKWNESVLFDEVTECIKGNSNLRLNQCRMTGFLYMLLSYITPVEKSALTQTEKNVEKIKEYLSNTFDRKDCLTEAASLVHISKAYMRNIFYKSEGISPQSYVMNLRIEKAKELLKTTENIYLVASTVGYYDQLQFTKVFKKYTGFSPTEFKKFL